MSQQTDSGQASESAPVAQPGKPEIRIPDVVPVIGSGSTVMYPQQLIPVLASDEREVKAVDEAAAAEVQVIGLFSQKAGPEEGHYEGELNDVGTAATVVRMAKSPDGSVHAILQGVARVRLQELVQSEPWMRGRVERLEETVKTGLETEALMRNAVAAFQRVVEMSETLPKELAAAVSNVTEPSALADFIAANVHITPEQRQQALAELDVNKRIMAVVDFLRHEQEVLEVESKIQSPFGLEHCGFTQDLCERFTKKYAHDVERFGSNNTVKRMMEMRLADKYHDQVAGNETPTTTCTHEIVTHPPELVG